MDITVTYRILCAVENLGLQTGTFHESFKNSFYNNFDFCKIYYINIISSHSGQHKNYFCFSLTQPYQKEKGWLVGAVFMSPTEFPV